MEVVVFSTSRVVTLLGPVFAAAAAVLTGWVAKHFPGLPAFSSAEVASVMGAVFLGAVALVHKWLSGNSRWEVALRELEHEAERDATAALAALKGFQEQLPPALDAAGHAAVDDEVAKLRARLAELGAS